jgi:membrane-bound serine protease (ClpP class)
MKHMKTRTAAIIFGLISLAWIGDRADSSAGVSAAVTPSVGAQTTAPAISVTLSSTIRTLRWAAPIHPMAVDTICGAARRAEEKRELFVLELDTPGGMGSSMDAIIKCLETAKIPVAVYVYPSEDRARADSAGAFIAMSADFVAMAPQTRIGSASPIFASPIPFTSNGMDSESLKTLLSKVKEDKAAQMRDLAKLHGRNAALLATMVTDAKNFTADEALAAKLADVIVPDEAALRAALGGRHFDKAGVRFEVPPLTGAQNHLPTLRQRFFTELDEPNLSLIFFVLGMLGVSIEIKAPGGVYPGVFGVIFMILFALSAAMLPMNWIGIVLLIAAFVMYILELKIVSHGALAVGGTLCLVLGGLLLFQGDVPELRVRYGVLAMLAGFALFCILGMMVIVMRSRKSRPLTGMDGLVGMQGPVQERVNGAGGKVKLRGELWKARPADEGQEIPVGVTIAVVAVEGLTVMVRPA